MFKHPKTSELEIRVQKFTDAKPHLKHGIAPYYTIETARTCTGMLATTGVYLRTLEHAVDRKVRKTNEIRLIVN
jgi:hypothetical protein